MISIDEFRQGDHALALKVFLETPVGKSLLELLEQRAKPSAPRSQMGGAEDIKLQMSLNFVAMKADFDTIDFIRSLAERKMGKTQAPPAPGLIPEDATPDQLKALGIEIPEIKVTKPTVP